MTEAIDAGRPAAPWHFWLVTLVALLWNGFGGYDYTMSHLHGETYYRQMGMTDAQIGYMATYPVWMHAVWAVGVWGSVLGSLLLLSRSRWAAYAFAISTLGAAGALAYDVATPGLMDVMSPVMPTVIVVVCLCFAWYAWVMTKRGVLR
jgi:hypothetical protein